MKVIRSKNQIGMLVRGGGGFDSLSRQPEAHRAWRIYEGQEKIPIGILVRGGGGLDPFCRRIEDKLTIGIYWSEGVAGLIPYHDKLKVRSQSILSSEGVAGLIPHENKL